MSSSDNKLAVLHCIDLYNKCTLEWVDTCYSKNLEWHEFSNPSAPKGRHGDFTVFRKSAEQALSFFPDMKLTVLRSVSESDYVVLEQEWQGTLAVSGAGHVAGEKVKLRVASFFTLRDGLIIKHIDYCASVE
jgi:predicted ester cyclase